MDILFIPDTQVKPGVPLDHLEAVGNLIVDRKPDVVVHIGDHWDMPSLSSYEDRGSKYFHDKSYASDVEAGKLAMCTMLDPVLAYNRRRAKQKMRQYIPRMEFAFGNHEERILRAVKEQPILENKIGYPDLEVEKFGWNVHDYLEIFTINGLSFSHFFVNPRSVIKSPIGGTIENRMDKVGFSFVMGHQQDYLHGRKFLGNGSVVTGLVCGSFYQHEEDYMNPQGNKAHYRGCHYLHNVKDGDYSLEEFPIQRLQKEYL